jgi:hypothetical protein
MILECFLIIYNSVSIAHFTLFLGHFDSLEHFLA